jgi:uncharacterized protein YkwD
MRNAPKRGSSMVHKVKILTCLFLSTSILSVHTTTKAKTEYRVQEGDTMWEISLINDLSLENLLLENPQLVYPDLIFPGDIIYIPNERGKNSFSEKEKLLKIINAQRIKVGLKPCVLDQKLAEIAEKKSIDMKEKQYVAHKSPTYGNPTEMIRSFQIPIQSVRENIGAGEESARAIFNTWMNSQLNRENLLQKSATHIGIGYAEGGLHGHYWTILIIEKQ